MNKEEILDHITEIIVQKFEINPATKVMLEETKNILNENYEYENNHLTWQAKDKKNYKTLLIEENRLSYYSSFIKQENNMAEEKTYLTICENKEGKISTHKNKKTYKTTSDNEQTKIQYEETIYHDYYEREKVTKCAKEKTEINKVYDKENNLKVNDQTYKSNLMYQMTTGEFLLREFNNNQTNYYICNKCPITKEETNQKDIEKIEISKETFENLMKKSYNPYLLVNDDYYYKYKDGFKI